MKNKSTIFLVLTLITILIILLMMRLFFPSPKTPQPLPVIQNNLSPTPTNFLYMIRNTLGNDTLSVTGNFYIYLSKAIDLQNISYTINPTLKLDLELDKSGTVLLIKPNQMWDFNTSYIFTLTRKTKANDGDTLEKDLILKFQTEKFAGI